MPGSDARPLLNYPEVVEISDGEDSLGVIAARSNRKSNRHSQIRHC